MKIKSKIILFVCAFAFVFSLLTVSSFASVSLGDVVFSESLNTNLLDSNSEEIVDLSFSCSNIVFDEITYDSVVFTKIAFSYRGFWAVDFVGVDPESEASVYVTVYNSNGWTQDAFRFASFSFCSDDAFSRLVELGFVSDNGPGGDSSSFYNLLYSSISNAVFGVDASLTPEQVMTLTLISTILSYAFILLPLLLVIGFVLRCFRL